MALEINENIYEIDFFKNDGNCLLEYKDSFFKVSQLFYEFAKEIKENKHDKQAFIKTNDINENDYVERPFILLALMLPLILLLWIYFDTFYIIENDKLFYRSGFLRGEIPIATIREIVKGKTMWSGIKPALARNGLIIKYSKFDEIYIAPQDNNQMLTDLLNINSKIKIFE